MVGILPDAPLASREKRAKGKGATKRGKKSAEGYFRPSDLTSAERKLGDRITCSF